MESFLDFTREKQSEEFSLSQGIPFQRSTLLKGEQLEREIEEEEELFPGKRRPSKKYPPIYKPKYRAKYPQLVYSEFGKPDFVDTLGREYRVARGSFADQLSNEGRVSNDHFLEPKLRASQKIGTLLLWIRIPIRTHGQVKFPEAVGEELEFFWAKQQVRASASTDGVYYGERRKTGYMFVRDFITYGQVKNPSVYDHLYVKEKMPRYKKSIFS